MITFRRVLSHTILHRRKKGCHGFELWLSGEDGGGKWEEFKGCFGFYPSVNYLCRTRKNMYILNTSHLENISLSFYIPRPTTHLNNTYLQPPSPTSPHLTPFLPPHRLPTPFHLPPRTTQLIVPKPPPALT
jgi:hypothetical protein